VILEFVNDFVRFGGAAGVLAKFGVDRLAKATFGSDVFSEEGVVPSVCCGRRVR
jgi:hypothetical protein